MKVLAIWQRHYFIRIRNFEGKINHFFEYCLLIQSFSLDIRSNNIKGDGLCSIADAVKFNSALIELFLWGNVNEERACLVCA